MIILMIGLIVGTTIVTLILGLCMQLEEAYKDWKRTKKTEQVKKEEKEKRNALLAENKVIKKYDELLRKYPINDLILVSMKEVNKEIATLEYEVGIAVNQNEEEQLKKLTEKIEKSELIITKMLELTSVERQEIKINIENMLHEIKNKIKETKEEIKQKRKENVREKFYSKIEEVITE